MDELPGWLKGLLFGLACFLAGALLATTFAATRRDQLNAQIAGLRAELAQAQARLAAKDSSLIALTAQVTAMQNAVAQVSAELSTIKAQLPSTTRDLQDDVPQHDVAAEPPPMPRTAAHATSAPVNSQTAGAAPPQAAGADDQCTAVTQKGTRCKRKARSDGRCWQHGG